MHYLLERLTTHWKILLSAVLALTAVPAALTGFLDTIAALFTRSERLPTAARWVVATALIAVACATWRIGARRRSTLLRPERLILTVDAPTHLAGRETDVDCIFKLSLNCLIVFVIGPSGVGKTALMLAGLIPFCHGAAPAGQRRLIPARIDAAALEWNGGLRWALSLALTQLSSEEQHLIGINDTPSASDPFERLARATPGAPGTLLLILDQIDDYAITHRDQLVRDNVHLGPEQLEHLSSEWASLAGLVRRGNVRLIFVCRTDSQAVLDAMRFAPSKTYELQPIEAELIFPVLTTIAHDTGDGEVIAHPECGWYQLKERLLRDLSGERNRVLPVRLALCLDSLRRFRVLTPQEYARNGGARGLERLHIERCVRDAAAACGVEERAVLRGLSLLLAEDASKTRRALRAAFRQAVAGEMGADAMVMRLIEQLEHVRIVRQQLTEEAAYLLLHHDYLAQGVREACVRANRWNELLVRREREFQRASGWLQRWQALLPLHLQARVLWSRLRGGCSYAGHGAFALWSLLRTVPAAALLAAFTCATLWFVQIDTRQRAEQLFAVLGEQSEDSRFAGYRDWNGPAWTRMADAGPAASSQAILLGLPNPILAGKIQAHAQRFAHLAMRLDVTGTRSRRLLHQLEPALASNNYPARDAAASVAIHLRMDRESAFSAARAALKPLTATQSPYLPPSVETLLRDASEKLTSEDVRGLILPLILRPHRPTGELDVYRVLAVFTPKLARADAQRVARYLRQEIGQKTDEFARGRAAEVLGSLLPRLEGDLVHSLVTEGIGRLEAANAPGAFSNELGILVSLAPGLDTPSANRILLAVLPRLRDMADARAIFDLGGRLKTLASRLEERNVHAAVAELLGLLRSAKKDSRDLAVIWHALSALAPALGSADARTLAEILLNTADLWRADLGGVRDSELMRELARHLDPTSIRELLTTVISRTLERCDGTGSNAYLLYPLVEGARLSGAGIDSATLNANTGRIITRMSHETRSMCVSILAGLLRQFGAYLPQDARAAATGAILHRIRDEENTSWVRILAGAVRELKAGEDTADRRALITTLVNRMVSTPDARVLMDCLEAVNDIDSRANSSDVQTALGVLMNRMRAEPDPHTFEMLASTFVRMSARASSGDLHSVAGLLSVRMKQSDPCRFSGTLARLGERLPPDDADAGLLALLACISEGSRVPERSAFSLEAEPFDESVGPLARRAHPEVLTPTLAALEERMRHAQFAGELARLSVLWVGLEDAAHAGTAPSARMTGYLEFLDLPMLTAEAREHLLAGLERVTGAKFGGQLAAFLDWLEQEQVEAPRVLTTAAYGPSR